MVRICPHCHKEVEVRNGQQFGSHLTNCKLNPKVEETINKIKETKKNKHPDSYKKVFKLICKCGKPFDVFITEYQYKRDNYRKYCSRSCANKTSISNYNSHNEVIRKKISEAVRKKFSTFSKEKKRQMTEAARKKARKKNLDILFLKPWDGLSVGLKRKRVLIEQDYKCFGCGITEWNGKPIILHFHHADSNKKNNSRENVSCLCPNCHSQTDTWAVKHCGSNLAG